ncbi:hypothetical protein ACP4OV_016772 [Aristida adscensionis]
MEAAEAEKESPRAPRSLAATVRELRGDVLMLAACVALIFSVLLGIGELVKGYSPVKGSPRERIGSVISDVGAVGTHVLSCSSSSPFQL